METTAQNTSFGLILACRISSFDIEKDKVIGAFQKAALEDKFIPKERLPRRAFRKALKTAVEGENFLIRPVATENGIISCGLVQEEKNKAARDLKYQVPNVVTLDSSLESITCKTNFRTQPIIDAYKASRQQLGSVEVAFKVKEILYEAMGINVLCKKGVFIPFKFKDYVDRLKVLFTELGEVDVDADVEVLSVENNSESRETIIKQFMVQTLEVLDKELEFTIKQRKKYEDGIIKFLKPSAFRKQLAKVKAIEERIRVYIPLLELSAAQAEQVIQKMQVLDSEITKNIELASNSMPRSRKPTIKEAFGS